ncbi:MAG: hypothetical protein ABI728_15835, partial [Betaproteobacteria bacterium]
VYQPFLEFCNLKRIPVIRGGFDWRSDIQSSAVQIASQIESIAAEGVTLNIVAHSQGGLVAAAAMNRLSSRAVAKVRRLITCGTPWHGAYRTVELFTGRHEIVQQIVRFNSYGSSQSREKWRADTVEIVAGWPGAYDLLPMPELRNRYPETPDQDFTAGNFFAEVCPAFSHAAYAAARARRPINVGFPPSIQVHNWRGIGRQTSGPMPSVANGVPEYYFYALLGDSTVPEFSSLAPAALNAINRDFDADHEQFLSSPDVHKFLAFTMGV